MLPHQKLITLIFIFSFTSLSPMQKYLPDLQNSLTKISPEFKDLAYTGLSWEPFYEGLNECYQELMLHKATDPEYVKEILPILAAGCMQTEQGLAVKLCYSPAHYALGVMALEDKNFDVACTQFERAIRLSKYRPQERNVHLHAAFACAHAYAELKQSTAASILYTTMLANLEQSERALWEPKIRAEITTTLNDINIPWRTIPALALSNKKEERNLAPNVFKIMMHDIVQKKLKTNENDLARTIQLIRLLADKNLSPHAQMIMAMIHFEQREKQFSLFGRTPINTEEELKQALSYARSASTPDCKMVLPLRGEIAYWLGIASSKSETSSDPKIDAQTKEFFKESAECEFAPGSGRYAQECLEAHSTQLSDAEVKEHLNALRRASRDGIMGFQDLLAKAFFFGHTFGCGYALTPDLKEAYEHAANSPSSLEMLLIRGLVLSTGLEKQAKKKQNKISWELKPNQRDGLKAFESALNMNEELMYVRLHEFFKSPCTQPAMKEFIFKFVCQKFLEETPSLFALRAYGIMLVLRGDTENGIKMLENISLFHKNPYGYLELSSGYLHGDGLPQDFAKATSYCIKALRFFDSKSIQLNEAAPARKCILSLLAKLDDAQDETNEKATFCLKLITEELIKYGMTWHVGKTE